MNITRENFEEKFETIREAIRTSHFIALDAEFTGLRLPGAPKERIMDSVQARYDLARGSCSQFMLTQYGVCCFRYNDDGDAEQDRPSQRLEARPFNCFVVPSTEFGSDRVYSCQASSMDFLSNHGFDFQAWAAHGVPFLSRAEEGAIKDKLRARWEREAAAAAEKEQGSKEAAGAAAAAAAGAAGAEAPTATGGQGPSVEPPPVHTSRDGTTIESLEEPEKGMVKDALSKVKILLAESCSGGQYVQKSAKLDPMNGRQRWLMHEFVGSSTRDVKLCKLPGPAHARPMEIRTVCKDPDQQAKEEAKVRAEEEARQLNDLRRAVGFRRVVEEVFKAGKPVICHNGLLDLLHTHDKFVGPIPEDLDAGTKALHSLVPRLFDSKVVMTEAIAAGMRFPRTVLGEAHRWLRASFPASPPPSPPQTNGEEVGAEAAAAQAAAQPAGAKPARNAADTGEEEANGEGAAGGVGEEAGGLEVGAEGGEKMANGQASAAAAAAAERTRKGWDAVFAPGFEERYKGGGQEHEAAYDAYLTGCCFAAAAVVGLGVGLDELKGMARGEEAPACLAPVMNVVPLFRVFGGQQIYLPGPAPSLDLSRYVLVRGFPSGARTDAVMTPIKAVSGCEEAWFHWIDDTSGVAECKTAEGVSTLLKAAAAAAGTAAAAAAARLNESTPTTPRVVDPSRLLLEDLQLAQMDHALLASGGTPAEAEEGAGKEGEKRGAKRPRQENQKEA